jgi:hypothetical protein
MSYDQAKAEAFNRARAQGLPRAEALAAAGIDKSNVSAYAIDRTGVMGARSQIGLFGERGFANGTPIINTAAQEAEETKKALAEQNEFEKIGFERNGQTQIPVTPYAQSANTTPGLVRTTNYTEESTTSISGGGSTTIVATPGRPTPASQALDAQAQQTQREIEELQLANSGLGPGPQLSEAQQEANDARILQLQQQYNTQRDAAESAKIPTPPSINVVPNTTTTINTVAFENSVEVTPVNASDPAQTVRVTEAGVTTTVARSVNPAQDPAVGPPAAAAGADAVAEVAPQPPPQQSVFPTAFDNEGNLSPGFELDENNNPVPFDPDTPPTVFSPDSGLSDEEILARQNAGGLSDEEVLARQPQPVNSELSDEEILARQNPNELSDEEVLARQESATKERAKKQATVQARFKQTANKDWRVRLSLGPGAQYLYNATPAGVLAPLAATNGTDGVIFPYTPSVTTAYSANYEQYDLTHSNYRGLFYKSSRVGDIQIRGMFTAQDTTEANYLLAVIHFFRSVTKMFYGQDTDLRGTPPPICLLNGFGGYQFSNHPVVVSSFSYNLPNDVDYIRTTNPNNFGLNLNNRYNPSGASLPAGGSLAGLNRLLNAIPGGLNKGALPRVPAPNTVAGSVTNNVPASYVPTKMEIDVTLIPVQTRSQVSQQFSLKGFANGDLLKGGFW